MKSLSKSSSPLRLILLLTLSSSLFTVTPVFSSQTASSQWRLECSDGSTGWNLCSYAFYKDAGCSDSPFFDMTQSDLNGVTGASSQSTDATAMAAVCNPNCGAAPFVGGVFNSAINVYCVKLNDAAGCISATAPTCNGNIKVRNNINGAWNDVESFTDGTATQFVLTTPTTTTTVDTSGLGGGGACPIGHAAPSIVSSDPAHAENGVAAGSLVLTINWSEQVKGASASSVGTLKEGDTAIATFNLDAAVSGTQQSFALTGLKESNLYNFDITATDIEDLCDKNPSSNIRITFTTVDTTSATAAPGSSSGGGSGGGSGAGTGSTDADDSSDADSSDSDSGVAIIIIAIAGGLIVIGLMCLGGRYYQKKKETERELNAPKKVITADSKYVHIDDDDDDDPNNVNKKKSNKRKRKGGGSGDKIAPEDDGMNDRKKTLMEEREAERKAEFERKKEKYKKRQEQQEAERNRAKDDNDVRGTRKEWGRQRSMSHQIDTDKEIMAETNEGDEVLKITTEIAQDLKKQLNEPIESRKKTFKFLQLKWHPDKNADQIELANKIFQFIQEQKPKFLGEYG